MDDQDVVRFQTQRDFREAVENRLGLVDNADWDAVVRPLPLYDDVDLRKALNALRDRGYGQPSKQRQSVSIRNAIVRGVLIEDTWEHVQTVVEKFRVEHFGSPDPPFTTLTEAASWIEAQEGELVRLVTLDRGQLSKADLEALGNGEIESLTPPIGHTILTIHYFVDSDGTGRDVPVCRGALEDLYKTAKMVASWWGIPQLQAVAHIMLGARTYRHPLRVKTTIGTHQSVVITITDPSVTPEQVAATYVKARKKVWSVERGRSLTDRDASLALFVKENPDIEKWWDRLKKWNQLYPDWQFETHDTMRVAYHRTISKAQ